MTAAHAPCIGIDVLTMLAGRRELLSSIRIVAKNGYGDTDLSVDAACIDRAEGCRHVRTTYDPKQDEI